MHIGDNSASWVFFNRLIRISLPEHFLISRSCELAVFAAAFTLIVLLFMKRFGFVAQLRALRRQMQQHLYAVILYHRSPRAVLWNELMLGWCNIKLILWLTPTLVFGGVIFACLFDVLIDRYATAPLPINRPLVLQSQISTASDWKVQEVELRSSNPHLAVEAVARIPDSRSVWTRLRADDAGMYAVQVGSAGMAIINVARPDQPSHPIQSFNGLEVRVEYPPNLWWGWRHGWLFFFFAWCILTGIPTSRLLGVRV